MRSLDRREFLTRTARGALALGGAGLSGWPIRPASAATDELATLDALAQAELVRAGKLSPRELLEAAIARAEALNPRLNAIVTRMYEAARGRADGALPEGPFTGVPTLVKDLTPYAGVRLTFGCRFFKDNVADFTHPFAERMERGGFVVLGKCHGARLREAEEHDGERCATKDACEKRLHDVPFDGGGTKSAQSRDHFPSSYPRRRRIGRLGQPKAAGIRNVACREPLRPASRAASPRAVRSENFPQPG